MRPGEVCVPLASEALPSEVRARLPGPPCLGRVWCLRGARFASECSALVSVTHHLHLLVATDQQSPDVQQYDEFLAQVRHAEDVVYPLRHRYGGCRFYY